MTVELDHVVVAAASLDDGVRWCEATLGVTPSAGGKHALMGTHNRLLAVASPAFPRAYLEIIAIDPDAPAPGRPRWFGLDDPALARSLEREGPRLVHWVARTLDIDAARETLRGVDIEPGTPVRAARGDFRWHITLRDDGVPQYGGAAPALIQWDAASPHPADALPDRGVMLQSFVVAGLSADQFAMLDASAVRPGPAGARALVAELSTPGGLVTLSSA